MKLTKTSLSLLTNSCMESLCEMLVSDDAGLISIQEIPGNIATAKTACGWFLLRS